MKKRKFDVKIWCKKYFGVETAALAKLPSNDICGHFYQTKIFFQ